MEHPVSKKFVFADKALIQAELPVEEVLEVVTVEQGEGYTQDPEAEQAGE
jgi:hypothetical protein